MEAGRSGFHGYCSSASLVEASRSSSQKDLFGLLVRAISLAHPWSFRIATPRCGVITQMSFGSSSGPSKDTGIQRCSESSAASPLVATLGGMSASSFARNSLRVRVQLKFMSHEDWRLIRLSRSWGILFAGQKARAWVPGAAKDMAAKAS